MSWSIANLWNTAVAKEDAETVAGKHVFCGPAVVAWIASVWNRSKGRSYDLAGRLADKSLFPDGPREFNGSSTPGFQTSLNAILLRETNDELKLASETVYRYGPIHDKLEQHDMPIIIRMWVNDGASSTWHYTTLYKSEKVKRDWNFDRVQFYWQERIARTNILW